MFSRYSLRRALQEMQLLAWIRKEASQKCDGFSVCGQRFRQLESWPMISRHQVFEVAVYIEELATGN